MKKHASNSLKLLLPAVLLGLAPLAEARTSFGLSVDLGGLAWSVFSGYHGTRTHVSITAPPVYQVVQAPVVCAPPAVVYTPPPVVYMPPPPPVRHVPRYHHPPRPRHAPVRSAPRPRAHAPRRGYRR